MNSMNYIGHSNLRLCSRNEGKIKSYESCRDIRAWSHDVRARDCYLREWIKCDMPICVLPTSTLAKFMRTMTCRSRGKATPRCHPDCKSKVVLDSICNSCHVMKECFKNEKDFDKYFDDEEFETSHWPCERCLEALKSIKMFWKIIIEKLFNVNIPKDDEMEQNECCRTDSVRSVAKLWQNEMMQQAMFVRNICPYLNRTAGYQGCIWKGTKTVKKEAAPCNLKPLCQDSSRCELFTKSNLKSDSKIKTYKMKSTDTDCLSNPTVSKSSRIYSSYRKQSRHSSAKEKMVDIGCDCDELTNEIKEAYKTNCEYLQEKCNSQKKEIEKLKRENSSLRIELQNVYKNSSWKSAFFAPSSCASNNNTIAILPKPFDCCLENNADTNQVTDIDSEMIITMKNCKNETYRHISLLQVLHKTNDPDMRDVDSACCNRKEDPIELLTKVQNTFGAIVKREMDIAYDKRQREKSDIDATYYKVNASKSAPSCSTITVASSDSHCDFRLTRES